jgi:hypothetical protein
VDDNNKVVFRVECSIDPDATANEAARSFRESFDGQVFTIRNQMGQLTHPFRRGRIVNVALEEE